MYTITLELEDDVPYKDAIELLKSLEAIPEVGNASIEKIT